MRKEFENKAVLVTGASSGIGAETAKKFAQAGAHVAFSYRQNTEGAEKVKAEIETEGVDAFTMQTELSNEQEAQTLVEKVVEEFGRLDILVNNAGGYIDGDEWDEGTEDIWTQTLKQNLVSVLNVSKHAAFQFQKQRSGVIVNVASKHGLGGQLDAIAYAASKAGVINVTQAYADVLAPFGRANSVSPGAVNTGYWLTAPQDELEEVLADKLMGRFAETEEVADAILYLASGKAGVINGQNLVIG